MKTRLPRSFTLASLLLVLSLSLGRDVSGQAHYRACHISTQTTTTCKTGAGIFYGVVVNNANGATITIYDNTAASGTVLAIFTALNTNAPFI